MEAQEHQPTQLPYLDLEHFPSARMVVLDNPSEWQVVGHTVNAKQPKHNRQQPLWLRADLGEHPPEGPLLQLVMWESSDRPSDQGNRS